MDVRIEFKGLKRSIKYNDVLKVELWKKSSIMILSSSSLEGFMEINLKELVNTNYLEKEFVF